jgi:2-C-methyl-D-erythritol 4-phosphate cytidylyltransferase
VELSGIVPLPVSVDAPALTRIVATMLSVVAEPRRIVVAAAESLVDDVSAALASTDLAGEVVTVLSAAATRACCLQSALESLQRAPFSTSHVIVHDISSPLASPDLAARVVGAMRDGGTIVAPTLAVTDSVKAVDVNGAVTATVDRSALRTVQYPRCFTVDALTTLLGQDTACEFDEIATALGAGLRITVVDGDPDALRVELPGDAEFVEAIIASREPDPHGA